MKKELTLKEIQMVGLNVLLKVVQICDELGLNYSLAYGTMIGAVRHNGFIPWDDIDIYMMREDYEKLKNYYLSNFVL